MEGFPDETSGCLSCEGSGKRQKEQRGARVCMIRDYLGIAKRDGKDENCVCGGFGAGVAAGEGI